VLLADPNLLLSVFTLSGTRNARDTSLRAVKRCERREPML